MAVSSWACVLMIGLLQTTAVMGFGLSAMRWISAQTTAILLFTNPLWAALASRVFLDGVVTRYA
jgi:drug/metabolite transporter (DMT)-like permease